MLPDLSMDNAIWRPFCGCPVFPARKFSFCPGFVGLLIEAMGGPGCHSFSATVPRQSAILVYTRWTPYRLAGVDAAAERHSP